ncbi:glycosyltransferase family 9 protein [Flavobacterium sp.]|uniref:glycosyltransferase family 9 protein n=1 Tax=Flavobacterium sp. TaxID=239 RepID=UPI0038D1D37C
MKVLVIQKKRIGDVLTSTIIFEALKEKFPESELHYLIYENAVDVVKNNPFIDKIVLLDNKARKSKFEFVRFLFSIRKEKYDVVIDAYGKPNSVLIGWFSGAKKTITFYKNYAKLLYTDTIYRTEKSFSSATRAIEHRMQLLEPLEIRFKEIAPKIIITNEELEAAKADLIRSNINPSKPIIMISAVGSNTLKTYRTDYLAEVLNEICNHKEVQILFNYLPFQKEIALEIYNNCNENTKKSIFIDYYKENLREFLAITKLCDALIGNEGGATNMAKALSVPTFTLFSPTVPKEDWNMFENDTTNISVHINDYEIIKKITFDEEETTQSYLKFKPHLFKDKLIKFINYNIRS